MPHYPVQASIDNKTDTHDRERCQLLNAVLADAEEVLVSFDAAAICRLEQKAEEILRGSVPGLMNHTGTGRLVKRCAKLEQLLKLSASNLSILQGMVSRRSHSMKDTYARRTYPWQH